MRVFKILTSSATLLTTIFMMGSHSANAQSSPFASSISAVSLGSFRTTGIHCGEADGDGFPDFFANQGFLPLLSGVDVYLGDSLGQTRSTAWVTGPALAPVSSVSRSEIADLNGDGLSDVVFATSSGTIDVYSSTGKPTQPYTRTAAFNLAMMFPTSGFWENYMISGLQLADINGDGFIDLVTGGAIVDQWSGLQTTIPIQYALGDGTGGFGPMLPATIPQGYNPASAILNKWVDADPNIPGKDTIILITEQIFHPTQYTYPGTASYIETLRWQQGTLAYQGANPSTYPSSMRATSFASQDLDGDNVPEMILGGFYGFGANQTGAVEVFQGTSSGAVLSTSFQLGLSGVSLPALYQIRDVEVTDLDQDDLTDIVAVFAYDGTQNSEIFSWEQSITGTLTFSSYPDVLSLPGFMEIQGNQYIASYAPNRTRPNTLGLSHFDLNPYPDLVVADLYQTQSNPAMMSYFIATATNDNSSALGDDYWVKEFGTGSMTSEGRIPRTGTKGGAPFIGNANFEVTLNNAPSGVAVMGHAGIIAVNIPIGDWVMPAFFDPLYNSDFSITNGSTPGEGKASVSIPVPNNPSLFGQDFYFTYSILDQNRPSFPFAFADPIHVRPGAP